MDFRAVLAAAVLLSAALIVPADAYHIVDTGGAVPGAAGDWVAGNGVLTVCESTGPSDLRNPEDAPHGGVGGLCTTGRNGLTGYLPPQAPPAVGNWVRLDVCDALTGTRLVAGVAQPCSAGDSLSNPIVVDPGRTDRHGWTAEVGAFSCFVPTDLSLTPPFVLADYSLYYQDLYAFWSYDGDGFYATAAEEAAFHGHVAAHVDSSASDAGASLAGSMEASAAQPPLENLFDQFPDGQVVEDPDQLAMVTTNCGSSPSEGLAGPALRAPHDFTLIPCTLPDLDVLGRASSVADFEGTTEIRLTLGDFGTLGGFMLDAPSMEVASYNAAGNVHSVVLQAVNAGHHQVSVTATQSCLPPFTGEPESLVVTFTVFEPGDACAPDFQYEDPEAPLGGASGPASGTMTADTPHRYIVAFHAMPPLSLGSHYNGALVVHLDPVLHFAAVEIEAASGLAVAAFRQLTTQDPNVRHCNPDGIAVSDLTPNDPGYPSQYGPGRVEADDAWDTTTGGTGATVCVVDTGVDGAHPDLAGARWLGGYDFVNSDGNPADDHGHGTHVAGIAAATINNNLGVAGLAQANIKAAKVLNAGGSGWYSWIASGIRWCADNNAKVINLSLGGAGGDPVLSDAVNYAWDQGALLVAATGNNGCAGAGCVKYPAAYAKTMAVGCTDASDARCSFSNGGPEIDIAAPGLNVLSTCTDPLPLCGGSGCPTVMVGGSPHYARCSGTSMSTPHVAGAAALLWNHLPALTNADVRKYLECKADDLGAAGYDTLFGQGRLDVKASLDAAIAGTCDPCTGSFRVNGAPVSGPYSGVSVVDVVHTAAGHSMPGTFTVTPSFVKHTNVGHDQYKVWISGSGSAKITVSVKLSCGTTINATWKQTN